MIHIEEQDLDIIFPSSAMSFVLMQPFVRFSEPPREPYRWSDAAVPAQLNAIRRTLELAIENENIPQFVVLPEYSVPGLAGVQIIDEMIRSNRWPSNTIVIAGIDGLLHDDYRTLNNMNHARVHEANAHARIPANQWVNCCVTWTKEANDSVKLWLQPKIRPASPELQTSASEMFCGSAVNLFKARYDRNDYPCRFFSLICFDWIARIDGTLVPDAILANLDHAWAGSPAPLHWVFVLQQNARPNHHDFLGSTKTFLTDTTRHPSVERGNAVVVLAANAASAAPSRAGSGAFSGFVFSPTAPFNTDACKPTFCMSPEKMRQSDMLSSCRDIVFREMGACIHICKVRVPKFVTPTVTDRTHPVTTAIVCGLDDSAPSDPRLPSNSVPASIKWVNDEIDQAVSVADSDLSSAPLRGPVQDSYDTESADIRTLSAPEIERRIHLALSVSEKKWQEYLSDVYRNIDEWDTVEREALDHIMSTIAILGACQAVDVKEGRFHGRVDAPKIVLQLIAIKGGTHQECRQHFDRAAGPLGVDPVILVTRDSGNNRPAKREMRKVFDPDRDPGLRIIDYSSVVQACIDAESTNILREKLNDIFRPDDKRII